MLWISLVKTDEGVFVVCHGDNTVAASESEYDALRIWEGMYHRAHGVSYERSMSACIHMLHFQPSVISVADVEEILTFIEHENKTVRPFHLRSVAGSLTGLKCTEDGLVRWEKGRKPSLV